MAWSSSPTAVNIGFLPTPVTSSLTSSYWQVLVSWYSSISR